jgi:hypothetical protein
VRRLRGAGYYIGIIVLIAHVTEMILGAWPPRLGSPSWRIGFASSAATTVFMSLLIMFIMITIAVVSGDRRTAIVLAGLSALAAALFVGMSGMFALDALQMRNQVRQQLAERYDYTSAWVLARQLMGAIGFVVLTVAAFRSVRGMRVEAPARTGAKGSGLIMGGVSAPAPAPRADKTPVAPGA